MIKQYSKLHNYDILALAIAKDNGKFLTGSQDKSLIVTDVLKGKTMRKMTGHTQRVNSVCFNQEESVAVINC